MMEILVTKNNLLKSISLAGNVTSNKTNTLPILGNILLETQGEGQLRAAGTDLEVGLSTHVPCKVIKEGSITIPAKKFQEIVRELPEGETEISVAKNNSVTIRSGKAFFKIMGLSKEDFPKLPEIDEKTAIEFEQALVKESLELTSFAISNDETRYVLNGVLLSIKGNQVKFVATDGRRLAFMDRSFESPVTQNIEMIIPTKSVIELIKILGWDGLMKVYPSKNQVVFEVGETLVFSRVIEGSFPNYEQVIPKSEKTTSQAKREDFLQAVRRTALLTSADSPAVKLDFVKGKILISSRSPNLGEAKEEIHAEVKGEDIAIGFNPHYLLDVLKNLDTEQISFSLTDPDKPGLIKAKDGYQYVIMPMQLN
ncbi:MAG: DNA polymerase III subunit beta [Candidatus Omnitrophica bacterium]|nr:DNA polymerase III subunit beta [Candidatus Omnitrophota bacterium]